MSMLSELLGSEALTGREGEVKTGSMDLFTPEMQQLFSQLVQGLQNFQGPGGGGQTAQTIGDLQQARPLEFDQFFQTNVRDPLMKNFQTEEKNLTARNLGSRFSSDVERGRQGLQQNFLQQLTAQRANIGFQERGRMANQRLAASGLGLQQQGQRFEQSMAPMQLLAQILGIPQIENFAVATDPTEGALGGLAQGAATGLGIWAASDERMKKNVKEVKSPLKKLKSVRAVKWDWKDKDRAKYSDNNTGVLAQELEKQFPHLVSEHEVFEAATQPKQPKPTMRKHVDYNGLTGVLVGALAELADKVDNLELKAA